MTTRASIPSSSEAFLDGYLAHQTGGSTLERAPEDVKRSMSEFRGTGIVRFSDEARVVESWDSVVRLV